MTSQHLADKFWSVFTIAIIVRIGAEIFDADRGATGWVIWRVLVAATLLSLAGLWLVARFREGRQAAGGTTALVQPWLTPVAGAAAVVCIAVALDALL
jgi:hypothetical protein